MTQNSNLSPERGPNVWDRDNWGQSSRSWDWEPWALGATGAGLLMYGLSRRRVRDMLPAFFGAALIYRSAMGCRDLSVAGIRFDQWLREHGWCCQDVVHEASDESFPASDAPAWTPTTGHRTVSPVEQPQS